MNQILSVEMPKSNKRATRAPRNGKASTKSVVVFFSVILIVFGIVMALLGTYAMLNSKKEGEIATNGKPVIDISQNASILDIEVSAKNEISSIQYRWNDGEFKDVSVDGTKSMEFSVNIPGGENTLEIEVEDIQGMTNEYSNQYVGLNAVLDYNENTNTLKIVCQEQKVISNLIYYYDNEEQQKQEINNTNVEIEIPIKQGEHNLTIMVEYEDGTNIRDSKKVYFPVVEKVKLSDDGNSFILKASDEIGITKVKINLNGNETIEDINNKNFDKTLQIQNGENRLILTVYNSNGVSTTTRTRWIKN